MPFVVLVSLHGGCLPDFYIYRHTEFTERVREIFEAYMSRPKKGGGADQDPGFRWFNEASFTDADRAHMNDWQPILHALGDAM